MATMADVARSAGVSVATVSHVLNGTRPVLPHTRQAVLDAMDELGYTPNTLARSLVTSRTRSIGLAVSAISNPYFTEILQGVEAAALEHGYSLLIADPHDDPEHERKVVQLLHERRVDGMIVTPSADPRELIAYLGRHNVPTVLLDRVVDTTTDGSPHFDQVCADSAEPVARLVTHLADLGHRRIALVAGLPGLSTTSERLTGYRDGLAAAGLAFDEHLVMHGDSESAGAEQATAALLSLASPPTALVTANNAMTIGALRALRDRGLSVPDDIALCCFDDFAWADLFSPRLTAIAQPSRDIGAHAVRVLLDRLASPDRAAQTVRLPCTFVHRTSCGCAEQPRDSATSRTSRTAAKPETPEVREIPARPGEPEGTAKPPPSGSPEQPLTSVKGTIS
ncbi:MULTISPECIES: LacI family DNA-binding transcriptional regulator [unclassified Streptomyces]|uniref:LacI family DNA-binding transcriptional regulator n=1 Tax=unclassified Streptomyces TaxID=2593676 RepID=UPI00236588B7|nr:MULTISPECIES: LacI family DNA-binding transcriptional regulator [unclassified Streptomyces]MDF3144781.1 LacI family DNA-binding transcriptional regulator [Streptomyces sp. T21Q-yed]WDF37270.1 LacI family DNA-binding transcriptional regulator [Streptomyces sp. T12]